MIKILLRKIIPKFILIIIICWPIIHIFVVDLFEIDPWKFMGLSMYSKIRTSYKTKLVPVNRDLNRNEQELIKSAMNSIFENKLAGGKLYNEIKQLQILANRFFLSFKLKVVYKKFNVENNSFEKVIHRYHCGQIPITCKKVILK